MSESGKMKQKTTPKGGQKAKGKKNYKLNMKMTLILFAVIPLICSAAVVMIASVISSSSRLKSANHDALVSMVKETGAAFDYATQQNETTLKNFAEAPVIKEYLRNPGDAGLKAKAQEYTKEYMSNLEGWEGIYLADWDSKVLTHPSDAVVGKTMREGDKLKELQDGMKNAEGGVYNVGIITSPASGQLVMSMYAPVLDDAGNPIGYVGGGTFVADTASKFSDVTSLGMKSAYIYFVDANGTMLFHPTTDKIGKPVENEAVKSLVAKLAAGEHPDPTVIEYVYKGANKYAAYYIDANNRYIAVLTVDESDVLASTTGLIISLLVIIVISTIIFTIIGMLVARLVYKPLSSVSGAINKLSTGDVTVECNTKSKIKETREIIDAFDNLKSALESSMGNVKGSAGKLNLSILSVDKMTAENASSISEINNAIDEVANTSQTVAESAQEMAERAIELGDDIEVLNTNVAALYDASQSIKNANDEATDCMKSVHAGALESVEAVQNITKKIADTNAAIEQIGAAIQAIESIAAQTNLLSLNASIEAARAGESGKGFAVVADEIRTLADSSAESAKEIKQIVENIIALSEETVEISNRVFEVTNKEQVDIENAQDKFTVLSDSVEFSINGINELKAMGDKLDDIKNNIAQGTSDLGSISEELGATAEEVAASCQTVTMACEDTQNSTAEMKSVNENMSSAIDFFKL